MEVAGSNPAQSILTFYCGVDMKVEVYNLKTGDAHVVDAVDAAEYVAIGGWSMDKPASSKGKPRKVAEKTPEESKE